MGNIFSGSEIVELGIQIEKNGRDFYDILARNLENPRHKDRRVRQEFWRKKAAELFKYLKGEEEKHIVIFQKILGKTESYQPVESYPGEYFAYMNALASNYVFTQKDKGKDIAKKIKSDKEAVDTGIGFEKDSILFYEGMKKTVPEHERKIVDDLILQEQNHLRQLTDLKKNL